MTEDEGLSGALRHLLEMTPSGYVFSVWDVLLVLAMSFALCWFIAKIYSATHRGISYSQSFVHTMVIVGMVSSSIMLIVGSNIARAFTLLGAMSIVRFRNAMKDPRDLGYIFWILAVGMACGTRFYLMAILMTLVIAAVQLLMEKTSFGGRTLTQSVLKLVTPTAPGVQDSLTKSLKNHLLSYSLINREVVGDSTQELTYIVSSKKGTDEAALLAELRTITGGRPASLLHGDSAFEI